MAKNGKIDKKTVIWVVIAAVALAIVVAIIVATNQSEPIPENYFASDDTKLVITMRDDMVNFEDSEYEPEITHFVYYYEGDKITNVKVFYEYENNDAAKEAYTNVALGDWASNKRLNGRYIVFQAKPSTFNNLTATEIRESIEDMRAAGTLVEENYRFDDDEEDSVEDATEEPSEN